MGDDANDANQDFEDRIDTGSTGGTGRTRDTGGTRDTGAHDQGITRSFGWSDMFVRPEDDPRSDGGPGDEREVLVHMIEEYARHAGHADLLRERIDGRVGQ